MSGSAPGCAQAFIRQINISDVRDGNGCRVSHFIFGRKRSEQVYAISSFGVQPSAVNAVPLEQFGANSVNHILIIKIKAQHSALSKATKTQSLNRKIY